MIETGQRRGTRFVVDLGTIELPYEQAKTIEADIRRVVLSALAGLDLVPASMVPANQGPIPPGAPMSVSDFGSGLPEGEIYGLLVGPDEPPPPPVVLKLNENPF